MVAYVKQICVSYMLPRKLMKIRHKWWGPSTSNQSSISEIPCFFMMFFSRSVWTPKHRYQRNGKEDSEKFFPHSIPLRVIHCTVGPYFCSRKRRQGQLADRFWRAKTLIFQEKIIYGQSFTKKRAKSPYQKKTSWWFQPIWKILVKMGIFPK